MSKLYDLALNDFNNGKKNWVSRVKYLLDYFGYSDVFYNLNHSSVKSFQCIFKQHVLDCFMQEWYGSLDQSVVLEEYRHFKHSFTYEYYLDVVPYDIRFYITRIRLSAHSLRIQTGRYGQNRIPRHERFCMLCNSNELEDMYHFICVCPSFVEIRNKYLPASFIRKPSMYKLCQLFQSKEKKSLCSIAHFLKEAFFLRNKLHLELRITNSTNLHYVVKFSSLTYSPKHYF